MSVASAADEAYIQASLASNGIGFDTNSPFAGIYQVVAARNLPASWSGGDSFQTVCDWIEGDLRARAILQKCGGAICGLPGSSGVAGSAGQQGQPGIAIGPNGLEATGIKQGVSIADALTGGIASLFLGPLLNMLAQKDALEQTEENVIGQVASAFNQSIPGLDAAVNSGQVSVDDAVQELDSVINQLIAKLETLELKNCDATCEIIAELKSHLDFAANFYYPAIAPGGTEATYPTGVPAPVANGIAAGVTPLASGSGASGTVVSTVPLSTVAIASGGSSTTMLVLLLAVILAVAFFLKG